MNMSLHLLTARPAVANVLTVAQDLEAKGFLRGVGRLILIIVVILVLVGVLLGIGLSRIFRRRR